MTCDVQAAYFAGLVDGEGYIGIRNVNYRGGRWKGWAIDVTVTNGYEPVLLRGQARWGGRVFFEPRAARGVYRWKLASRDAVAFLREIMPFLCIKHEQAEIALELQTRIDAGTRGQARTGEEAAARQELQDRIRAHNQRRYFPRVVGDN